MKLLIPATLTLAALLAGCAPKTRYVRNTRIADTSENREILTVCEEYRRAVERLDVAKLVVLASPRYHEDGGTLSAEDDYGNEGLRQVLATRFQTAKQVRYGIEYRRLTRVGARATVDIYIDASFLFSGARGDTWHPVTNYNRLELEYDSKRQRWLFLAGM